MIVLNTAQIICSLIISLVTVFGIFTGVINKLFTNKLKPIEDKINREHEDSLRKDLQGYRLSIVSFASDLRKGIVKSKHEYEAIYSLIDLYDEGVKELHITNHLFTSEVEYINKMYAELTLDENN